MSSVPSARRRFGRLSLVLLGSSVPAFQAFLIGVAWNAYPCQEHRILAATAFQAFQGVPPMKPGTPAGILAAQKSARPAVSARALVESFNYRPPEVCTWPFVLSRDARSSSIMQVIAQRTGSSGRRFVATIAPPSTRRVGGVDGAYGSSKGSSPSALFLSAAPRCQTGRASIRVCVVRRAESRFSQRTGPTWLCTMSRNLSLMNKSIVWPCAMTGALSFSARRVTPSCRRVGSCGHEGPRGGVSNRRRRVAEQPQARMFSVFAPVVFKVLQTGRSRQPGGHVQRELGRLERPQASRSHKTRDFKMTNSKPKARP